MEFFSVSDLYIDVPVLAVSKYTLGQALDRRHHACGHIQTRLEHQRRKKRKEKSAQFVVVLHPYIKQADAVDLEA